MRKAFVNSIPKRSAPDQEKTLLDWGMTEKDIYVNGRGAESLSACIASFRGRPGQLFIAADLRVLGQSRKAILETTSLLEKLKITIGDIYSGETSLPIMLDTALSAIASEARGFGSKKTAKVTGRRGGHAKADNAAASRALILREEIIRRICAAPELTWDRKVEILGKPFTEPTLRRHYVKK